MEIRTFQSWITTTGQQLSLEANNSEILLQRDYTHHLITNKSPETVHRFEELKTEQKRYATLDQTHFKKPPIQSNR